MVKIRITISRYQEDKKIGKEYRASGVTCTFTEFKKQKKEEMSKPFIYENESKISMTLGSEKTFKKVSKRKLSPKRIDKLQ